MKTAIIGYGNIAPYYIKALENKINKLFICSRRFPQNVLNEFQYIANYKDEKLKEADLIIITTPPYLHFEMMEYFLKLNKKVIIEKPAVVSKEELSKIKPDKNLYFAYHSAFNPLVEIIKKYINISKIKNVNVNYQEDVFHYHPDRNNWIFKSEYSGGGCLIDSGINIFSILYQFLPELHYKEGKLHYKKLLVEDSLDIDLTTESLIKVNIQMDWLSKKETRQITIIGDTTLEIDLANNDIVINNNHINLLDKKINKIDLQSEYSELINDAFKYFKTGETKINFSPVLPLKTVLDIYKHN